MAKRNISFVTVFLGSVLLGTSPSLAFSTVHINRNSCSLQNFQSGRASWITTTSLYTANDGNSKNLKTKGVYVRPSGAIERGSGFFVPGLEGPRVRLLFGTVIIALTALNHVLVLGSEGLSLEETIAIGYSLMVLFQAAIEFGKEELIVEGGSSNSGNGGSSLLQKDLVQQWNAETKNKISAEWKDKIQWAAASYLSVTPATQILLLTKTGSILYRLGDESSANNSATIDEGVQAALNQLRQSKGGRLALPNNHRAVVALGLEEARTVVLQRIDEDSCWVVSSSDQLLASFTPADLKWLGQLSRYVQGVPS